MQADNTTIHFSVPFSDQADLKGCYGSYETDEEYGFRGRLFLPNYQMSGPGFLDLPQSLDVDLLTVLTENGKYTTFCYPQFNRRNWNNFSVLVVDFRFRYVIDDLRVDSAERCVESLEVSSPTIASLIGQRPVQHVFYDDFKAGGATFNITDPIDFAGDHYVISIGANRSQGSSSDSSEVYFRSHSVLTLKFPEPVNVQTTLEHVRMLDDMISVMSGTYAAMKAVSLRVILDPPSEPQRKFALRGYGTGSQVVEFVYWHDVIARATPKQVDWAKVVETFEDLWNEHKIAFKWFRSAQINKRYVEEKFAYAIRLAERYFKPKNHVDVEADMFIRKLRARLDDDATAIAMIDRRIAPILRGSPSLVTTLRLIFEIYPEFIAWEKYEPQTIARLRGKEMHGGDAHYSGDEYQCMYDVSRALLLAFRLDILRLCGFDTSDLITSARRSQHTRGLLKDAPIPPLAQNAPNGAAGNSSVPE